MRQFTAAVSAVETLRPGLHVLWSDDARLDSLTPGQFVMLRCGEGIDPLLRKSLSLYRKRRGATGFLFGDAKPWGQWLARRRPGDVVDCIAPLGRGFSLEKAARRVLIAAEGIGMAAVSPVVDAAIAAGCDVAVISIGRDERSRFPADQLPAEAEVIGAEPSGAAAEIERRLQWADQLFLAVGWPLVDSAQALVRAAGGRLSAQAIVEEKMACGVGACLGCVVRTKRGNEASCVAGPVFDLMALRR